MTHNQFKAALRSDRPLIGLWVAAADPYVASISGGAGFDWLLLDGEHAPNDVRSILGQLMALHGSPSAVVVRPPNGESRILKQLLDIGAETLLVPMVDTAEQARALVRGVRYPPDGIRGMGAGLARANDEVCLLVQAESRAAMTNLEEIVAVDGVDGVFIGPVDLAADMGEPVDSPAVQAAIEHAIDVITRAGRPAGILTFDHALNHRYLELGARFVAVGADVTALATALGDLAAEYGCAAPLQRGAAY